MIRLDYLPFLLIWALPILALEWLAGGHYLWRERRLWPWVVLGLGAYFTLADAVAIQAGIWRFDMRTLIGVYIGPVPIEEVLFYLLTAAMVVQGFVIAWDGWTLRHASAAERRHWLIAWIQRRTSPPTPPRAGEGSQRTGQQDASDISRVASTEEGELEAGIVRLPDA